MGISELEPELRDTDVFQVLCARRVAPSERERLMHLVPYPEGIDVKNPLPEWALLPLSSKIPFVQSPKDYTVYKRGKLGESVRRQGETFDLSDPHNYGLQMKYEPIHDRHLRHYFYSPGNKKILDDMGILTKENQVKCQLHEYNAYRGYVYNVHKNSVMKALRERESLEADKAEARKFLGDAARLRENQAGLEKKMRQALLRSAHRKVINACRRLRCEHRLQRVEKVKEKMKKQREQEQLKLLINKKNFQEQLKNYRIKSQEVNWRRNIRAQNKWKQFIEKGEYRKCFTAEVDKLNKMYEVIENWIKKELFQMEKRERDVKIYNAYKAFSDKRKAARSRTFKRLALENARKITAMKEKGPTPKEVLEKQLLYQKVGNIYAGVKKLPPNMNTSGYEKPIIQIIMAKALAEGDNKSLAKKYWGQNVMKSRATTEIGHSILECIYIRTVKLYLKYAIFRYLPILITELSHVIALFEEDMRRKNCTVDEIRRFARSYVGQRKGDIFHSLNEFAGYGYVGQLKRKLYRSRGRSICRCDSESEREPGAVQFNLLPSSAFVDKDRRVSFQVQESHSKMLTKRTKSSTNKTFSKAPTSKLNKKTVSSILKQCPLKKRPASESDKTDEAAEQDQQICCSQSAQEICVCSKEVKRVTFGPLLAKNEIESNSVTETIDKTSIKVSIHPKPNIITIPIENTTNFDFKISNLTPSNNIKDIKINSDKNQNHIASETKSCESDEVGEISILSSFLSKEDADKKVISALGRNRSAVTKVHTSFADKQHFSLYDKIKSSFKKSKKSSALVSQSSLSNRSTKRSFSNIFEDIYAKFKKVKDPNSAEANIHVSSSSTISSISEDNRSSAEENIGRKNNFNVNDDSNKIFTSLATDGGKHRNILNNNTKLTGTGSDCKAFDERANVRSEDANKRKLIAKLNNLIRQEKNVSGSETSEASQVVNEVVNENESVSLFNNETLQTEVLDRTHEVVEENTSDVFNKGNEEAVMQRKSFVSIKSKENDLDVNHISIHFDEKRGTELRGKSKHFSNSNKGYNKGRENANYHCLEQVFQPMYKPKYFQDTSAENLENELKSILTKTPYSAAENCSLVPKLIKHYKLKDIDHLRNFVLNQMSLGEAAALAAVKTEGALGDESSKICKQVISDTINLESLKKFSKEVIPRGEASFNNFIRISKVAPPSEQKKPEEKEELDDEVLNDADGPFVNETVLGKTTTYTRLVTEALPEVNEVYTEFFSRDWPEVFPLTDSKDAGKTRKTDAKNKPAEQFDKKKFNSPQDVIEDSINYKERCLRGEIVFSNEHSSKDKQRKQHTTGATIEKNELKLKKTQSLHSSDTSEKECVPERHGFSFLEARLLEPDEVKLCGVCGMCSIEKHGGKVSREPNLKRLLRCAGCGACVHDLATSSTSSVFEQPRPTPPTAQRVNSFQESQKEMTFCNDHQVKRYYWKKYKKNVKGRANLKAVFGEDFDNDKFVFFVHKDKDYICWKDLLKKRYPVHPFPWDEIKLERLKKRKLPLNDIKYYAHPKNILRNKVAKGYGAWESSKTAEYEDGKEEITWNKVPKKYEKLFSTTIAPANRPARTFKPVKDRRPTPMPSLTDLVTSIAEESCDMYEARRKVRELRAESSVVKSKVDTAVRALMDSLTNIAVLKLKEGYPSLAKTAPERPVRYYYVPTGYHKHFAEKLAKGLGEVLYDLELKEINFARLQPLADIILRYLLNPKKYPLIFPESAFDLLDMTDSD